MGHYKSSHVLSAMSWGHQPLGDTVKLHKEGTEDDRLMHEGQRKSNLPSTTG